jgi:ADP-ribose pyrophosphatase YjhB (NUDIX family)
MKFLLKFAYQAYTMLVLVFKPHTVGVRILLVKDDNILLVKHTYQDKWYIPGGMVERGESVEDAVRREAQEELGARLDHIELFGVYSNLERGKNDHVIVFKCDQYEMIGSVDREISEVGHYPIDALPLDLSNGSRRRVEELLYEHYPNFGEW